MNNFIFKNSGCSSFQQRSVASILRKFYKENKNKVVLADEVGMGKTYVCRGLLENAPRNNNRLNVFYIAPNEVVLKQNFYELSIGFVDEKTRKSDRTKRLSALRHLTSNDEVTIRSFSASMFFNTDESTMGTVEERELICNFLFSIFSSAKESKTEELNKWAIDHNIFF